MRRTCTQGIRTLADRDERVVFIGSDITKRDLASFQAAHPRRFLMEGVCEQNLVGMAAGLALCGKIPYINTIGTFLTRRCYEQILVDLGVHNLRVRLVASGGGTVYAPLGITHVCNEDIAILRAIPNMTILAPCDADEMARLLPLTLDWPHPIYIRMAKGGDPIISRSDLACNIGKAIRLRSGRDALLIGTGVTSALALEAAELLEACGISCSVLHMHTLKPFDEQSVVDSAAEVVAVVTIEEHRKSGGLGSAVAETLLEAGLSIRFSRIGFPDVYTDEHGSQTEIMAHYGITGEQLAERVRQLLGDTAPDRRRPPGPGGRISRYE